MARPKLPPNLVIRHYRTREGAQRTLYYVRFVDWKGIRRTIPAGDVLSDAKALRDRLLGQNRARVDFDAQARSAQPFTDYLQHWLELHAQKRSATRDRYSARHLAAFFARRPLDSLSVSDIEAYKRHRLTETTRHHRPPTPATVNRELALLRSVLLLAEKDRLIDRAPRFTLLEEHNQRHRVATPKEYATVLAALPVAMQPAWILARETGMRAREILSLQWEQIDQHNRLLTVHTTKEGDRKVIPLNTAALDALRRCDPQPTGNVFPFSYDSFSHQLRDNIFPRLGIQGLWFHDLRGTFISEKIADQWDRKLVRLITGHRTDYAFDRYVRPTLDTLRQVVERQRDGNRNIAEAEDEEEKPT